MKKLLIFIFCSLILTACEDEPEVDFNFPDDIINKGIKFGPSYDVKTLYFNASRKSEPKVSVEEITHTYEEWLSTQCYYDDGKWILRIAVSGNDKNSDRRGYVNLKVGKSMTKITVIQKFDNITIQTQPQILPNTGGELKIRFISAEKPKVAINYPAQSNSTWCSLGEITEVDEDTYEVPVSYKENTTYGRIAKLWITTGRDNKGFTIVQRPKQFDESEIIKTDPKGGSLPIALGYTGDKSGFELSDFNKIQRIKHLTIEGGINEFDLDVLRLFTKYERFPVTLDLSKATFLRNYINPYESFGYTPPKVEFDGLMMADNYIPSQMFYFAQGLVKCILPENTIGIGSRAFYSTSLTRIDIPASVVQIDEHAFRGNYSLKEINIDKSSRLEELNLTALSTSKPVKAIYLPSTITHGSPNTNSLVIKTNKLYLDKTEIPEWRVSWNTVDTLYVPDEKLIEVFKADPQWGNIPVILAWPEDWKSTPWGGDE